VTVSEYRRMELAGLFSCPPSRIQVVYNGVDPVSLQGLSAEGVSLLSRLGVLEADLALLMPVRVTQAKNIELAFRVVASLQNRGIRPILVITGPPDPHDAHNIAYYQGLLELRHELGVDPQVRFVYESGPDPDSGYVIGAALVNELFRACDVLFLPSHREGFGMPILEAGLVGMPIFTTDIPAAHEIGQAEIVYFSDQDPPDQVAGMIMDWFVRSPVQKLRLRVRQQFTWQAIFHNAIEPLLTGGEPA
jgi:glycosyltransferase involved in cell wall biosynthesis